MTRATDIADDAVLEVGNQYAWAPTHGAIYNWATGGGGAHAGLGVGLVNSINCYSFPILLAIRRGYINPAAALRIFNDIQNAGAGMEAYAFSTSLVATMWTDWKAVPGSYWRPRRGDLVFFEGFPGGLLNHVALSTGNINALTGHSEVISFGERMAAMGQATVNRTSIELLRQAGHTSVKFIAPSWD